MIYIAGGYIDFKNKNEESHRLDGPAVIEDHYQVWWLNGMRHRLDGPAIIIGDDYEEWYKNGRLHRLDGPAVISSYNMIWYIEGVYYNEFDYLAKQEHDHEKLKEMGLV